MVNSVFLVGNLGRDAELKYTTSGTAVSSFSLATSKKFKKSNGESQKQTEWHTVTIWGKTAEALTQYLEKGTQVCVRGEIHYKQWVDKDGNKRVSTEIVGQDITLLGSRPNGGQPSPRPEAAPDDVGPAEMTDDDIPF